MPRKIYVASSWRNEHYPSVIRVLRSYGHKVYDFRNPTEDEKGFSWKQIGLENTKDHIEYINKINHPIANYKFNMNALNECDTCLLLLPCGKDAHLEAGYAVGMCKEVIVFLSKYDFDAGLMYKMITPMYTDIDSVYNYINNLEDTLKNND
jgi:chitinase